ncbi:MAG: tetratricopeptide repeat protein [Selenomonadaceae bacterium]|nr:tetratricopeptide repeat protein [Selenomonadaceae bacterium]
MKKFFALLIAFAIVLSTATSEADEELIEASGEYVMDSRLDETAASATARAREEAKRAAIEKAGVYLQSYSKMIDLVLEEDEVQTVTAQLLKIQEETSSVEVVEKNLLKFTVTIKALINNLDEKTLKAIMNDRQSLDELIRKNKELQEKYDALNRQMEKYRKDFDSVDDAKKIEIKKDVEHNTKKFYAINEFSKGNDFSFRKNFPRALATYDAAIELDPQFAEAYNNRGIVKYELGQISAAVEDYTAAVKLKSNYADALLNRGIAYAALEQFQNAEKDFRAALKLNDKSAAAHNNLGSLFVFKEMFNEAVEECTRAIRLNPNFADAWYNRAVAYYGLGDYSKALSDAQKSLQLNPNDRAARDLYDRISRQSSR